MKQKTLLLTALVIVPMMTLAASETMNMERHGSLAPASQALMSGMQVMHDEMMAGVMSAEPDVAFAKGMIAHHQGAINMAQIQLKYGKDPEMKKLAEAIIKAQQPEIDQMQQWLTNNPK